MGNSASTSGTSFYSSGNLPKIDKKSYNESTSNELGSLISVEIAKQKYIYVYENGFHVLDKRQQVTVPNELLKSQSGTKISAAILSQDQQWIITGEEDGVVRLYNVILGLSLLDITLSIECFMRVLLRTW